MRKELIRKKKQDKNYCSLSNIHQKWILSILFIVTVIPSAWSQTGPGGVYTPTENVFWLRSDNGVTFDDDDFDLSLWSDRANSNNASNISAVTNPTYDPTAAVGANAEPAILFSSVASEFLDIADDATINTATITERTIYFVFKTGSDITTTQYLYQQGNATDGIFAFISADVLTLGINSASTTHDISTATLATNTDYIARFKYDGGSGTLDLSLNGTTSTQTISVAASVATHNTIKLGSDTNDANFLNGHIAEIIYYNQILNDGETRVVDNFLSEKYGITEVNDHYSTASTDFRYEVTGIANIGGEEHNASNGGGGALYLSELATDPLSDGEFVFAGNNANILDKTSTDMSDASLEGFDRLNRVWFLEKTGGLGITVEFDLVEAGFSAPTDATEYELITRSATTGNFTAVSLDSRAINGDRIQFNVSDANWTSGYYTLATLSTAKSWYVINSGDWDDTNTWTLDPAGVIFDNPDLLTPSTSSTSSTDEVTVLSGKTVTISNDGDIPTTLIKLTVDGTLDFGSTIGHGIISELSGSGTILLSGDDATSPRTNNLPTIIDDSNFTATGTGQGTIEYYGDESIEITSDLSFYNLTLDFDDVTDVLVIATGNTTINGNLNINTGNFQINDDTDAARRVITVEGDIIVENNGAISTGTGDLGEPPTTGTGTNERWIDMHDTFHRLNIGGNMTNSGIVNFSNLSDAAYQSWAGDGAVTVRFFGSSDASLTCDNTTNFYDLMLDKGSDNTYVLTVNSSQYEYFKIFGRNSTGHANAFASNPDFEVPKPLYIANGTLRLTGSVFIPSLTEGAENNGNNSQGQWILPQNGSLWLDGPDVIVWVTTGSVANVQTVDPSQTPTGISVRTNREEAAFINGTIRITDGTLDSRHGGGIFYSSGDFPQIIVEGGNLLLSQMRQHNISTAGGMSYLQSGGTTTFYGNSRGFTGQILGNGHALLSFETDDASFVMSGGDMIFTDKTTNNPSGINVDISDGNTSVTGGTIIIDIDNTEGTQIASGESFQINFSPNFYNLTVADADLGSVEFQQDLIVTDDLIIEGGNAAIVDMQGNDLTVGRNFSLETGATFNQNGNTSVAFNGDSEQSIILNGTLSSDFFDMEFSNSGTKNISKPDGLIIVANHLIIESGATVDNGGNNIRIENMITNSGTLLSSGASTGQIVFSASSGYQIDGDGNGVFGNIALNDANDDVTVLADFSVTGQFRFNQNNQLLNLGTHRMTFSGEDAVFSGADSDSFVLTSGNDSDGGLSMYFNTDETLTFPIGTDANGVTRYTPVEVTVSNFVDEGNIAINPVDDELSTTDLAGDEILSYYWKVDTTGFDGGTPDVAYTFTYDDSDTHTGLQLVTADNYEAGRVLDDSPFTRSSEGVIINASNDISFSTPFTLEKANYTAGEANRFDGAPLIFYSKEQATGISFLDDWSDTDRWTRSDLTGFNAASPHRSDNPTVADAGGTGNQYPQAGDIAIIGFVPFDDPNTTRHGDPHHLHINSATEACALLSFTQMTNASDNPVARDEDRFWAMRPSVLMGGTALLNADVVEGEGEFFIRFNGDPDFSNVDLGDFVNQDSSLFFYEGNDATLNTYNNVPAELSNLIIGSTAFGRNNRTIEITTAFTINQNLEILGNANFILPDGADISVGGNIRMFETFNNGGSNGGAEIRFPNSGLPTTLTVFGDIIFENEGAIISVNTPGTTPLQHTLNIYGSVYQDSDGTGDDGLQLWTADGEDFISLNILGDEDETYEFISGDVPSFSNFVINKGSDPSVSFMFNSDFNLAPPTAAIQPIVLENGTLILNNAGIGDADDVILTNDTNGEDFDIPSTAALQVTAATLTFQGDDLGITLNGSLTIDGGTVNLNGGNNNYIAYASSGNASITISDGALTVGSQIRKNPLIDDGVLNYAQSGGTVTIGENTGGNPSTGRSMLEVSGDGSSLSITGGSLTIANDVSTAGIPTLYLAPDGVSVIENATIQFGDLSTVTGTNAMSIQSEVDLFDLILDNSSATAEHPTLTMLNIALVVQNNLTIEANTNLNASGLALNVGGNFSNIDGASGFTANNNTTTLDGTSTQIITGDGTTFYNLIKSESNTLQLASGTDLTVENNFTVSGGILDDNNNDITVNGILHNAGTHTNNSGTSSNNGIILAGTIEQDVTGEGTYSRIRINNTAGIKTNADINITEQVILNGGILDIQDNELAMGDEAIFVDATGSGFSTSNMVETRRSFTDAGIVKTFNGIDTDGAGDPSFIYPIGSGDKYTPIVINLTQNSQTNATIAVRAADEPHPNVQEDIDVPEFVDQDNVLQYYWELTSSGMTDFTGEIEFTYIPSDAYVTSPFTLDDYFTARLLPDASNDWNKIETGFNYLSADGESTITFDLSTPAGDSEIGGEYTAGVESAVPDEVQTVTSVVNPSGEWTADGSWNTGAVPRGAIVLIEAGDQITISTNAQVAYATQVEGELILGDTENHRLGDVSGSGIIRINSGSLPAGEYSAFFDCDNGGTIDFGSANSYTLPNEVSNVRNLEVSDGGIKSLPNTDIVICGDLTLDGSTTLDNPQNNSITVLGDLIVTNGTMDIGTGVTMTVEGSVSVTTGSIEVGNNTLLVEESLNLNGGTINMNSNGSIDIGENLVLASGTLNGSNSTTINIGGDLTRTSGLLAVDGFTNTISFNGSSQQSLQGDFTGANSFSGFEINNASGLTIVDGGNDIEINGALAFTNGIITTNSDNTITITSSGSSSGGNSTSFVNGPLTKADVDASGSFTFHIGTGTNYAFASVENVGTGGQDWTAEFSDSNANSAQPINTAINPAFGEILEISPTSWNIEANGTNSATIVLGIQSHMNVEEILNTRIAEYDKKSAGEWVNLGGTAAGDASNGSITSQVLGDFSSTTYTLGGVTTTALPVTLLSFDGETKDGKVLLSWTTASEVNNDYFELERSTDGSDFEYIGYVSGNGTTNQKINYSYIDDRPYSGVSYYRLTQIDFDGEFEILGTISADNSSWYEDIELVLFPNPASSDNVNLRFGTGDENTPINVVMYHLTGSVVHHEILDSVLGVHDYKINVNTNLPNGIYHVIVSQGANKSLSRIIIR